MSAETADEGIIEHIVRIVQPLRIQSIQSGNNGEMLFWAEGKNASDMQTAIRALGNSVGPNNVDLSTATVVLRNLAFGNP